MKCSMCSMSTDRCSHLPGESGWWRGHREVMGLHPYSREARTRESGAAGLWVKAYVSSSYGHVYQVFNFRKPTVFPGLSSAQPSLAGFCSSASAYVNDSNPVFSTHQLMTGLPMWKTPAIRFLNHFKSLEALHLSSHGWC